MEENNENNIIDDNIIKEVTFNPTEIIDQNKNIQSIFQQVDNFLEDCLLEKKTLQDKKNNILKLGLSKLKQKSTTNENVFTILDELIKTSCIEVDNLIEVDILDSFELIDLKSDNIINILKKIKSDLEGYEKEFDENTDDSDQSKLLLTEIEKLDNDLNQIEKIYKPLKIKFKKLTEKLAIYSKNKQ